MKKFTVIYRVSALGSVYQAGKVIEAQNEQDAIYKLKQLEPRLLSTLEIREEV